MMVSKLKKFYFFRWGLFWGSCHCPNNLDLSNITSNTTILGSELVELFIKVVWSEQLLVTMTDEKVVRPFIVDWES